MRQEGEELMSKEAMKLALKKIKAARNCHPNAVDTLLFEAEEILEEALASEAKEQPAQQRGLEMVDDEGENQAVRMFLALYGGACGVTSEQMRKHLKMAGFDGAWPEWASNHNGHLTKAGAQLWIRHLFALEQPAQQITEEQVEAALKAAHMHSTPESRKDMRRAIEAAYGIKENT